MVISLNESSIQNIRQNLPKNLKQILDDHLCYKNSKKSKNLSKQISQKDFVLLINYLLKKECLKFQEIASVLNMGERTVYTKLNKGVDRQKYRLDRKTNQYILINNEVIDDVKEKVEKDEEEEKKKKEKVSENHIETLLDKLNIISEKLSRLESLNEVRDKNKKMETETELDYGEFITCNPKNFGKQTMYMYHPLYEASKPIILKKYRLIYEFFNQIFFKAILEDYLKLEKEKNIDYIFNRQEFNRYLNNLVNKYIF